MKLIIADDHPIILDGLQALLHESRFEVLARCGSGEDVLARMEQLKPDVLVLDLKMQPVSGLDILHIVRERGHGAKVVILTGSMDDESLVETVRLGVDAILLKKTASRRLLECLDAVSKGERWLDPDVSQRLMQATMSNGERGTADAGLTPREMDITRLVAAGLRNKQIAYETGMAEPTVKMHLHNIFGKLGVGSRTELAIFAHARGIL